MAMADGSSPVERLVAQLSRSNGNLKGLRNKLGLPPGVDTNLVLTPLCWKKKACLTYKITNRSMFSGEAWVVKCSPLGHHDSWCSVKDEYTILQGLHPDIPVPKPIYCSTSHDERIVGTEFIVLEFIQGTSFQSASEIPVGKRKKVCSSAMKAMANVHYWHWSADSGLREDFTDSSIIHGNLDISNFIFDEQYEVKSILDWKYHANGDPMVDVGYFLMMFLQPSEYHRCGHLQNIGLLMGPPDRNTPSEENMVQVYRTEAHRLNVVFSVTAFNYAKAVSCLRLISIIRAAWLDNWRGHECRHYTRVKDHPDDVIAMLTLAGYDFYTKSL